MDNNDYSDLAGPVKRHTVMVLTYFSTDLYVKDHWAVIIVNKKN